MPFGWELQKWQRENNWPEEKAKILVVAVLFFFYWECLRQLCVGPFVDIFRNKRQRHLKQLSSINQIHIEMKI